MSEQAMMSDSRYRVTKADPWRFGEMDQDRSKAIAEARRILAVTEREDAEDGLGDAILGWPYQDTPTALRNALAESLAAFVGADDPGAYLAGAAR